MTTSLPRTAEIIRSARAEAKLSQAQLGAMIGQPQSVISRWEKGEVTPHARNLDAIVAAVAEVLGRTPSAQAVMMGSIGVIGRSQGKLGIVADLMAKPEPKDWLVSGFLARRFVTLLAGQEGSGKSMLTQTLAKALANGDREAFGFRLSGRKLRGLVIDVENVMMSAEDHIDGSLVMERLQAFGLTVEGAENLTVVGASGFDLDKDFDVLDAIMADAESEGAPYDFVVLDSFRSLWVSGSENTPEAGRVLTKVNRLAYKHNCAVLLLHHTNKAGAAYSGHTSIGSTVAAVWTFSKLVHKDPETGKKAQHPTGRFLSPYKVRIAAEARGRIVQTSPVGIVSNQTADDLAGFDIDSGEGDDSE